ncbi:phospholipase A2 inhibitor and Ly6/PLAUR domain-containing protein-like [Lissotriton helveticus]
MGPCHTLSTRRREPRDTQLHLLFRKMGVILAVTCILSALLAEGHALSCQECSSNNASTCTGTSQTCTSLANTCISVITELSAGSIKFTTFARSCGLSRSCNKILSMSNLYLTLRTSTACCTMDNCTPETPQLPSPNSTQNGVICQYCIDESSTYCTSSETMMCTGAETKCISFSFSTTSGSQTTNAAVRGCATPSFCDIANTSVSAQQRKKTNYLTCTDSSIRLQPGILQSAIFGIFLIKFFV